MKKTIFAAVMGALLGGLAMGVHAAILSDSFTDGSLSNGTDAADADWYGLWVPNSGGTLPTVTDYSGDNKLSPDTGTAGNTRMLANFSKTTLSSAGDFIELTLNFSYSSAANNANAAVNWGLLSDGGTPQNDNYLETGDTNYTGNDNGYTVQWHFDSKGTNDLDYYNSGNVMNIPGTGSYGTRTSGVTIATSTEYDLGLRITREAGNTFELKSWIDSATNTMTGVTINNSGEFSEVVFYGEGGLAYRMDDVNVIPEPSSIALLLLGAGAFAVRRSVMRRA